MINTLYDYTGDIVVEPTFFTPKMYGAVGDGTTDDTSAVQTAVSKQYVQFTGGKIYKVTAPIRIKKDTLIDLNGATIHCTDKHLFYNFEELL